jgi:hypothetical protein
MYTVFTQIQEEPPPSQYLIFRKIPTQNKFNFVHNYMQPTIFEMMKQEKILTLWSGKYGTFINSFNDIVTLSVTQILPMNGSMHSEQ